jgi:hypothetical protein
MVEAAAQRPARERAATAAMRKHYQGARDLSRAEGGGDAVNSAINLIAADLASHAGRRGSQTLDPTLIGEIGQGLRAATQRGATFWSEVDAINLRLFEAVANGKLARVKEAIEKSYEKLAESGAVGARWPETAREGGGRRESGVGQCLDEGRRHGVAGSTPLPPGADRSNLGQPELDRDRSRRLRRALPRSPRQETADVQERRALL